MFHIKYIFLPDTAEAARVSAGWNVLVRRRKSGLDFQQRKVMFHLSSLTFGTACHKYRDMPKTLKLLSSVDTIEAFVAPYWN